MPTARSDLLRTGFEAERRKVIALKEDLGRTIENLIADIEGYSRQGGEIQREIEKSEAALDKKLKPKARELSETLADLEERRSEVRGILSDLERIERYKNQRTNALAEVKALSASRYSRNDDRARFEFSQHVEAILTAWNYSEVGPVHVNDGDEDIVIAGKKRKALGKGYRALTASAFLVALMEHCAKQKIEHPGFLVLDTPVRTFKDRKRGETQMVSDEVKDAFFRDLASRLPQRQIIVMENDDPPVDVQTRIHYVSFSANQDIPPAGFIPPLPDAPTP